MIETDTTDYFSRFEDIASYVGWSDEDALRLREAKPLVEPRFREFIDDFYESLQKNPNTMQVITGGNSQIKRLKESLLVWIDQLFAGTYDENYVIQRLRVGTRHVEIGLDQIYVNTAMSRLRQKLNDCIVRNWSKTTEELAGTLASVNRMLDLDLAVIQDAYQISFTALQKKNERYATIGKISGGIAHEVRNPLNVMKTSVYFLLRSSPESANEKVNKHLNRIGTAVEDANNIVSALSEFARLPDPSLSSLSIKHVVSEAMEKSKEAVAQDKISLSLECEISDDIVQGESGQLSIAFGNLIRNAIQAVDDVGEVQIRIFESNGKKTVRISDNGKGIAKEDLAKIADPLFSTKSKGLGLGLAITKAILDSHKAELKVDSEPGVGSEFQVLFPIRESA